MSPSPYTFEDLATPETAATIRARLVAALLADGQPTASWAPSAVGGNENLRADMVAGGLEAYMAARVAAVVNGRLLPSATDSAENGYFLTYLGKRFYKLIKRAATVTIQNVRLTVAATAGAQKFADGDIWVASPATGNKYRLTLPAGEIIEGPPGFSVNVPFYAENPGSAYLDAADTVTTMVTAKAGVTCSNHRPYNYAPTRLIGRSSGTITGFYLVVPDYSALRIRIETSGDIGTGTFSYSINGGLTWVFGGTIPSSYVVGATSTAAIFTNGTSPSFLAGSIFTLAVQDNFLQRGADAETDEDFRARCSNRHPARSAVPMKAHIDLWAHEASAEVDKVASDADANTPGGILVTIASATGPASPTAQAAVEDFILRKLNGFKGVPAPTLPDFVGSSSPEETCLVSSAIRFEVRANATVYVPRDDLAALQAAADDRWNAYLASLPIGGMLGATVLLEQFYTLLDEADDIQGLTFNDVAADLVIPTGYVAVVEDGWTLLTGLVWVAI
jgi:hypothetical protein